MKPIVSTIFRKVADALIYGASAMNITYNEKHFMKDGKPWFPVMGEFEYSRCDNRFWKDGILKMKALGCDVVQSYVIWLHHEEIEGKYNFRGNNNLRK